MLRLGELAIVVMTTATWHDRDGEPAVAGVVLKPFDIGELVSTVTSAVAGRSRHRAALVG